MKNEMYGPCSVKLFNKAGEVIELEGSYGMMDDGPTLVFNEGLIPPNFEPCRIEVKPIVTS
jgi:hypothetical protein